MKHLLRYTLGGVRLGLWSSVLVVANGLVGHWLFDEVFRWRTTLLSAALMPALFGLGGGIYGLLLRGFARNRTHPSTRARLLAGMAAGALASGLFASPYLLREPRAGHMSHAAFMLMFITLGMAVGAVCGLVYHRPAGHRAPSA
ncbi:MAG TPA: hypothetical protein VLK84_13710 [Longimicrobium sp.]|nr:hypothetical protein [Longimicrobium sp.]